MALVFLLLVLVALSAYGWFTFVAGADTRSGVDGVSYFGRRTHSDDPWWL